MELETDGPIPNVDWAGKHVGISVDGTNGAIKLSYEELRILRLLLERPIAGEIPADKQNPGLRALHHVLYSMELWKAGRR